MFLRPSLRLDQCNCSIFSGWRDRTYDRFSSFTYSSRRRLFKDQLFFEQLGNRNHGVTTPFKTSRRVQLPSGSTYGFPCPDLAWPWLTRDFALTAIGWRFL